MYYLMNKRFFLLIAVLLMCVCSIKAVPAHPGTIKVQQPDGSFVTLRLVGDEWQHFQTTADGYSVVKNQQGYYVYAEKKNGQLEATALVAHDEAERTVSEQTYLSTVKKYQAPDMSERQVQERQLVQRRRQEILAGRRAQGNRATNYSNFRGLIILIEFNDKGFSREDYPEIITNMVNKEGFTGFDNRELTGSVRDYFSDNSDGKFQPQFDIAGPYKVEYSQYDCNVKTGGKIGQILKAAIDSADVVGDVNFKDYDGNGDGYVDLVFFIVAGNGANYSGNNEDLWWPHRSGLWGVKKDGVYLQDYASSTELLGYMSRPSTVQIDGIGTIVHEFSHVLGLPDFYDTDYEKGGGQSYDPGDWSVMASGCYADSGDTPVGYSLYERYSVGFCEEPEQITAEGSYTLEPLFSSFTGFRIDSPVNKEFFLFENRQKDAFKWDKCLPGSGMLVHRVDKTNTGVWYNNTINVNPDHNYYEVVRAGGNGSSGTAADVFPGTRKVTTLNAKTTPANLKTWSGKSTRWGLKNIQMANGVITFDIEDIYALRELSLPESLTVCIGLVTQLEAVVEPDDAIYQLTWSSDNESVATVDKDGKVKGIAEGKCTITAESNNGVKATCLVIVEYIEPISLSDFKSLPEGEVALLQLTNAQVLYVYENTAYVREDEENGCIMFKDMNLNLKKDDVLNGMVLVGVDEENGMKQVLGIEGSTNDSNLEITSGEEAEPREKKLEELSPADYSDYVLVKQVQLVKDDGIWAVSEDGNVRVRMWNKFMDMSILLKNYDGKYFDVYAIYGTDVLDSSVINELYMVKTPVEVEAPTAINEVRWKIDEGSGDLYNLNGQRVDQQYKGLVIRNGRVVLNK